MSDHKLLPELKYSKEHEWAKIEDGVATIGITDFAQSSLGDIVFIELPEVDRVLAKDETFGVVESIKSVSDLFSPLSGVVIEINSDMEDSPEAFNESPYDSWILKLKLNDLDQIETMLTAKKYAEFCSTL